MFLLGIQVASTQRHVYTFHGYRITPGLSCQKSSRCHGLGSLKPAITNQSQFCFGGGWGNPTHHLPYSFMVSVLQTLKWNLRSSATLCSFLNKTRDIKFYTLILSKGIAVQSHLQYDWRTYFLGLFLWTIKKPMYSAVVSYCFLCQNNWQVGYMFKSLLLFDQFYNLLRIIFKIVN